MTHYFVNNIWKSFEDIDQIITFIAKSINENLPYNLYNLYGDNITGKIRLLESIVGDDYINFKSHQGITRQQIHKFTSYSVGYQNKYMKEHLCIYSDEPQDKLLLKTDQPFRIIQVPELFNDSYGKFNMIELRQSIFTIPSMRVWMKLHMLEGVLVKDVIIYAARLYQIVEYKCKHKNNPYMIKPQFL